MRGDKFTGKVRWGFATFVTLVGALLASAPAGASVIERVHYSGTFAHEESICGHDLYNEGTFHGLFMLKVHGDEPVPYFQNKYYVREVQTDAEGNGFIALSRGLAKNVRITHVSGTLYRFVTIDVGQVNVIMTLSGRVVDRNVGLLKFSFLIDTKGDADPSNDEILEETFLKDAGKHPQAHESDEEFCADIDEAIAG
jgi:hypothetical protein